MYGSHSKREGFAQLCRVLGTLMCMCVCVCVCVCVCLWNGREEYDHNLKNLSCPFSLQPHGQSIPGHGDSYSDKILEL